MRRAGGCPVEGGALTNRRQMRRIRELGEEIGMTAYGEVNLACELEESVDFKRDNCSIVVVRDVEYRSKRWSWEVESGRRFCA